jgi:AbrB family looped-hinge helix DNA binding protein
MESTSVTSKGQVTIPKPIRQQLGIRKGSKIVFEIVNDHIELKVQSTPTQISSEGFGMLKTGLPAAPVDLDPATLIRNKPGTK